MFRGVAMAWFLALVIGVSCLTSVAGAEVSQQECVDTGLAESQVATVPAMHRAGIRPFKSLHAVRSPGWLSRAACGSPQRQNLRPLGWDRRF
jgi:hypothetical protein